MPSGPDWTCSPYDPLEAARLEDALDISPATAAILARRGLGDLEDARAFLTGTESSDPLALPGAGAACDLVLRHVERGSTILVFGDYDVDGVCSTAMMISVLRALGGDPAWQLPSRLDDGYGLSEEGVRKLAGMGVRLLITVDCGITAVKEVTLAHALGMEVLVTDHHRPEERLPDCAVVHPGLTGASTPDPGESSTPGPNGNLPKAGGSAGKRPPDGHSPGDGRWPIDSTELCAAGVVLKLSEALRSRAGLDPRGADEDLDLAGLATICDMVPLRGENRRIAREGLAALARTRRPGLRALMREAGLEQGNLDARAASFRLGPRLNAAGRLHRADAALELLMTPDEDRAADVARELDRLNLDRRETEQRIVSAADAACREQLSAAAIVVAGEGWHPGVVGIVASRLVERHHRPCVVIGLDRGAGRGSARSIPGYDVHEGIAAGTEHLVRFGGNRMAAGLEIEAAEVDAFRRVLARHAGERLSPADLKPVQHVDAVVSPGALDLELAEELERLGPFGAGNPAPALLVPASRVEHVTTMGEEGIHARFSLAAGAGRARGVAFRTSQRSLAASGAEPQDVAVSLERNRWNGVVEARVVLRSLTPTKPGRVHDAGPPEAFWEDLEREIDADPERWSPDLSCGRPEPPGQAKGPSWPRLVRDRRGEGVAALGADLLTSGRPTLVVVSDVERRRASLERLVAGGAPAGLAAVAWEALAAQPRLAEPYTHLLALDPPPVPEVLELALRAPGAGLLHLAWGEDERAFALSYWRSQLVLKPMLAELWRALDRGRLDGEALEEALRGGGTYPRSGALCGRMVRVLEELGLAVYSPAQAGSPPSCQALTAARTELDRSSAANRAYAARLAAVERHLGAVAPARRDQAAAAGA